MIFFFGENNICLQIGNAYLEFDITVRKDDKSNFQYDKPIRLVEIPSAFCSEEARLSTTIGSDIEHNKLSAKYLLLKKRYQIKMVIYYLNLIIIMNMIYHFLRVSLICYLKLDLHHTKKCL